MEHQWRINGLIQYASIEDHVSYASQTQNRVSYASWSQKIPNTRNGLELLLEFIIKDELMVDT